jgi:hypothetical protein
MLLKTLFYLKFIVFVTTQAVKWVNTTIKAAFACFARKKWGRSVSVSGFARN